MSEPQYVTVFVDDVIRESESGLALLCEIEGERVWLPRGQLREPEMVEIGYSGNLEITRWIADEKNLLIGFMIVMLRPAIISSRSQSFGTPCRRAW